jgi:hypothetical protein
MVTGVGAGWRAGVELKEPDSPRDDGVTELKDGPSVLDQKYGAGTLEMLMRDLRGGLTPAEQRLLHARVCEAEGADVCGFKVTKDGDVNEETQLMYAVRYDEDLAEMVEKMKSDPEGRAVMEKGFVNWRYKDRTALMLAAEAGKDNAVKLLLTIDGIDVGRTSSKGETARSLAQKAGHEAVVKLLS